MRRPLLASISLAVLALFGAAAFLRTLAPARAAADPAPATQAPSQTPPETPPPGREPGGMPPGTGPGGPGGPPGMRGMPFDTSMAHADQMVAEFIQRLGPKANMPAESVFKNIQLLKGQPASMLPKVMFYQFSRGLGARCDKCHVHGDNASDQKDDKKIAREMWKMMGDINRTYLANMKDLEDEMPTVTCWTCHRGRSKPETPAAR